MSNAMMAPTRKKSRIKECTFYVKGMHCASCEILIEKALLQRKEVAAVDASTKEGQVNIYYKGKQISLEQINKLFKDNGYIFSENPLKKEPKIKRTPTQYLQVLGAVFFLLVGFVFLARSPLASRVTVNSTSSLPAFFVFGLVAGMSSCAALIGGLVLSMSKQWSDLYSPQSSSWQKFQPHLLFNFGRLISFALLGGVLGALGGKVLQTSVLLTSLLGLSVSVMMFLLALQMLEVPGFERFQFRLPKALSKYVADETNFSGRYMPFLLGALTFFLPCGFTITAQGLALTSSSSLQGSLILLLFALGTLPMLLIIGFSSVRFATKPHLSDRFMRAAGLVVLLFAFYNFNSQLNVLGLPSMSDVTFAKSPAGETQTTEDGFPPIIDGKQLLQMDALAYGYEPNEFKVRLGVPVRWEITNKGVSGCTNAVVSRDLFSGQIDLNKELAVKEFTPTRAGRYKFSCWMGMVSGTITVVDPATDSEQANPQGLPDTTNPNEVAIPSGAAGCGGDTGSGSCGGGCGGGCGNPGCSYTQ
ncbi:sulfite exporter TauE/SafE family protein [Candidatus Parcubacteria bacterium]|nr:sulfite exporter TauE/SafE family protein [Candidatus Parcubacteria bacterium]